MSKIPDIEPDIGNKTQFGILQLLAFTAVVAIALVCSFPESTPYGSLNPKHPIWRFVFRFSELLIGILCLSLASTVGYACFEERSFPKEPGRILLLISAFSYLATNFLDWLAHFLALDVARDENGVTVYFYAFMGARILSTVCVIGIGVFGMINGRWWWRFAFAMLLVKWAAAITHSAFYILFVNDMAQYSKVYMSLVKASSILSSIAFLGILAACVIDFAKTVRRSRLHWAGVGCYLLSLFLPWILTLIALRFVGVQGLYFLD